MNVIYDLVIEEDRPIIRRTLNRAVRGAESVCEVRWKTARGNILYLEGATTSQMGPTDEFESARFIFRDITERRETERKLIRLERLRSLGEMSAGVSHNLNNMLSSILLPAEIIQDETSDPNILPYINTIRKAGRRAADLVQRLHEFVKDKEVNLTPINLNEEIQDAVQITRPKWKDETEADGREIQIQTDLSSVPDIVGTEAGIHEILTNLIFNAVDAMPKGGEITLATEGLDDRVRMTVRDTGIGMNEQTRSRIFEPFFTTKRTVGTGLGLSTVYGLITRWGGDIAVESAAEQGTTFYIDLPVWKSADEEETSHIPLKHRSGERRRILIVEDDEAVCTALKHALKSSHDVETSPDGAAALEQVRESPFDVALIDLGLPGQPGDEVSRALRNEDPNLVTVLITGWNLESDDPRREAFDLYLQKPFYNLANVHDTLQKALLLRDSRIS